VLTALPILGKSYQGLAWQTPPRQTISTPSSNHLNTLFKPFQNHLKTASTPVLNGNQNLTMCNKENSFPILGTHVTITICMHQLISHALLSRPSVLYLISYLGFKRFLRAGLNFRMTSITEMSRGKLSLPRAAFCLLQF
jgi:hypothetical protein